MSKRIRRFERGAADLYSIAISMTIVAIAAIGTSYSLLYGRQALIHQEHYKTALYQLRGYIEEENARMAFSTSYPQNLNWVTQRQQKVFELESDFDRDGRMVQTAGIVWREPIAYFDDPLTSYNPDYYRITGYAEWVEPIIAGYELGEERETVGPSKRIKLVSYFITPR